ncbi:MAG: hypothetical protein WCB05_17565 [Candidatus Sulfotelmatobacter sp.]|jgi:hypothetical protein
MTLAYVLVIAAVLAVAYLVYAPISRRRQAPSDASLATRIQPLDIEAFRNLIDPAEREYLRHRLPGREFRKVQRQRLLAMAAYVKAAGQNAELLIDIGNQSLSASDPRTAEAARQLADNAHALHVNARYAVYRIRIAWLWPDFGRPAVAILHGYEQLNGSAMLLGRLQNPSTPVRISAMS